MPLFNAIVAMSENRVIGDHGKIPWHLPEDFRWFKHKTMGGTLIMGRKTFESIGKPLPGRKTVVLSRTAHDIPGVKTYHDLETLRAKETNASNIWICGGAEIYTLFLPYCSILYLTRVKQETEGDTFFPSFEETYTLNQVIHETSQFRIERWQLKELQVHKEFQIPPESWPFQ